MIPISFVLCLSFLFLFGCYNKHTILLVRAETGRFHLKERCQASHRNYYSNSNNHHGKRFQKRSLDKQYQNLTPPNHHHFETVNHKNDVFSRHAILERGGGGKEKNDQAVVVAENQQQQISTMNMLNDKVHNMKETARKIKRTEFWALFALRIAFIFILPLSIIVFGLTFVISLLLLSLRIITLNFCFREVSKISFATVRIAISLIMASITGIISPLFAIFGLLASISVAILEMAEPILRIRYARQMKKLAHLHNLITDPVLMETLGVVIRGASVLSSVAVDAGQSVQQSTTKKVRKGLLMVKEKQNASTELVETLIQSSGAIEAQRVLEKKLPTPVVSWGKDQWESLRRSGALEAAATRALQALRKDISSASAFLPYLEAIEQVRKQQGTK